MNLEELKYISSVKGQFELAILCGNIESYKLENLIKAFIEFEKFMKEKNTLFASKIDSFLDKKITSKENEIRKIIDECLLA
mgnify:CR=1 FL=1